MPDAARMGSRPLTPMGKIHTNGNYPNRESAELGDLTIVETRSNSNQAWLLLPT